MFVKLFERGDRRIIGKIDGSPLVSNNGETNQCKIIRSWIPYTGGPNKCELNCMPRGERFFYRHKLMVIDGTPCEVEKNDVCVGGKCMVS